MLGLCLPKDPSEGVSILELTMIGWTTLRVVIIALVTEQFCAFAFVSSPSCVGTRAVRNGRDAGPHHPQPQIFTSSNNLNAAKFLTVPSASRHSVVTTRLNAFGFFGRDPEEEQFEQEPLYPEVVVIEPDFRLALLFLSVGGLFHFLPVLLLGPIFTLLGVFFLIQTLCFRFVFDETSFELVTILPNGQLNSLDSFDNVFVGGANRWDTDRIFNYDFFPKGWIDGPVGPITVYFKEDQTPPEFWDEGPGKFANDPAKIEAGQALPGQVHFFAAIANAEQLREEFERRGCKRI